MKKIFNLAFVMAMVSFMAACDDGSDGQGKSKTVPAQEFMAAFANGGWQLTKVYDVYADGSRGSEILVRTEGFTGLRFCIADDAHVRQYHLSAADTHYLAVDTLCFTYHEQQGELSFSGGKLAESVSGKFRVESIDSRSMTCLGPVFSGNAEARDGLYVFERLSDSAAAKMNSAWSTQDAELAPVLVTPLETEGFMALLCGKVWECRDVCGLHENGSTGAVIPQGDGTLRDAILVDKNGWLTELQYGEGHGIAWQNDHGTFRYGNLYSNSLHFENVVSGQLKNIFRLSSVSDKSMECIGWPSEQLRQADAQAVCALYRFECVSDSVTLSEPIPEDMTLRVNSIGANVATRMHELAKGTSEVLVSDLDGNATLYTVTLVKDGQSISTKKVLNNY